MKKKPVTDNRFFLIFLPTILTSLLISPFCTADSFGVMAKELENKIYETIPRAEGEGVFTKAMGYATEQLTADTLAEEQKEFIDKFSTSYARNFIEALAPELQQRLSATNQEMMRNFVARETNLILNNNKLSHQAQLNNTLSECKNEIKLDVIALFAAGADVSFSSASAMPATAKCMQEKSTLQNVFVTELLPYKDRFNDQLLNYLKSIF